MTTAGVLLIFLVHRFRCDIMFDCVTCESDLKFYIAIGADLFAAFLVFWK